MTNIIDGKAISKEIKDEVKEAVSGLKEQGITVSLAVIQVGNDPASGVYVGNKKKACEYCGIESVSSTLLPALRSRKVMKVYSLAATSSLSTKVNLLLRRVSIFTPIVQMPGPPFT